MSYVIQEALTQNEKNEIYRLRYEIYIEEMNRKQHHANHNESAGYKVLDVVNEPNDCNTLVICKNI